MGLELVTSKFRGDSNSLLGGSLFYERYIEMVNPANKPLFSLFTDRVFEGRPLINCQKTFVELDDPTGYKWATTYLESWEHWQVLIRSKWFQNAVSIWQDELATKQQMEAIARIRELASEGSDSKSLNAAKYIAERGWEKNTSRGRPPKTKIQSSDTPNWAVMDADRLGIKLVSNNG